MKPLRSVPMGHGGRGDALSEVLNQSGEYRAKLALLVESGNWAICKAPPAACDSGIVSSKLQLQRLAQTTLDRDCRTRFGRT